MQQSIDSQSEALRFREKFLKKHPDLGQYLHREKVLLLILMMLVAAHKLSVLFAAGTGLTVMGLIGAVAGIGIPAIFVLAAYSGKWQCGFLLMLLGGYLAYDLFRFGVTILPRLLEGTIVLAGSPFWFYFLAATESACMILSIAVGCWLTIPRKNRELAELSRRMHGEWSRLIQEEAKKVK